MESQFDLGTDGSRQPRFGSYIGLFYVLIILGILSFAILVDVRPGHIFDRLVPGMTPTEVAAILGVPKTETRSGTHTTQRFRDSEGAWLQVEFESGKLASKIRLGEAAGPRS